jgi:hypothetical protein
MHRRNDNASQKWNPQPVKATIEFRGKQVKLMSSLLLAFSEAGLAMIGNIHIPGWRHDALVVVRRVH